MSMSVARPLSRLPSRRSIIISVCRHDSHRSPQMVESRRTTRHAVSECGLTDRENGSPCLYEHFYGGRRDRPDSPRRLAIFAAGVEVMLTNLLPTDVVSSGRFTGNVQRPPEGAVPPPLDRRRGFSSKHNEPA